MAIHEAEDLQRVWLRTEFEGCRGATDFQVPISRLSLKGPNFLPLAASTRQVRVETSQRSDSTANEEDEQRSHGGDPLLEGLWDIIMYICQEVVNNIINNNNNKNKNTASCNCLLQ